MFNYSDFSTWADSVFENEFPNETIAINFNLYEESDQDTYSIQIIGTEKFDEDDWACYDTYTSGEDLYYWTEEGGWEKALETAIENVNKYLSESTYSEKIKKYQGVGIGFVDGDIEIIYRGCGDQL